MKNKPIQILLLILCWVTLSYGQENKVSKKDTSYNALATQSILNMLKKGKPPVVTLQLSFNYDIGHMDAAANDNTVFRQEDFVFGRNFGTRYGYGGSLTGKISLHKQGNVRLNITTSYHRFQSNFVISESPEGKVAYNMFTWALGVENNFSPAKRIKPYIGLDLVASLIYGNAVLTTDSTDFNLKIKNSMRYGVTINMGFEYAFSNYVGFNLGYKITHANILGKQTKTSSNPNETYLNDDKVLASTTPTAYSGWKQFVYSSFYLGLNYYFGMKNKK